MDGPLAERVGKPGGLCFSGVTLHRSGQGRSSRRILWILAETTRLVFRRTRAGLVARSGSRRGKISGARDADRHAGTPKTYEFETAKPKEPEPRNMNATPRISKRRATYTPNAERQI